MKFLCERCGTRYSIADEKVRQKILKIRCKSCDNVITLRDSAVSEASPEAAKPAAPRPATASLPPPPRPAPPAVVTDRPEWHLAVDGQQKGPFTKAQLAAQVLAQKPGAEIFVWKEGLDGWKEPAKVPEIERALAQAKSAPGGRVAPPPRPPTSPGLPAAKPLAALAQSAGRSPGGGAAMAVASSVRAADHLGAFDEGEATQIQPLSAALAADMMGSSSTLVGPEDDDQKTPVANLVGMQGGHANGSHVNGNNGHAAAARPPLDLFSDAPSTPFFPPPAANPGPANHVAPAPLAPNMSMGGESGLSQVMSLGGRVSRKPALKIGAIAFVVLLLGAAVTAAVTGYGSNTPKGSAVQNKPAANEPGGKTPEEVERAAAEEANKWFPDQPGGNKVAHVGGDPRPAAGGKKPVAGAKPTVDPLAPPPLAPAPAGAENIKLDNGERKVDLGLAERRALPTRKPVAASAPVDQAAIGNVVRRKENQDAVKLCYNRVLRRTGSQAGGRIEVTVNIGISGKVKSVALSSPPALNAVHDCLKQAVNRWHFPAGGEDYETGFTLVLSGS
ncbi:MAG: GYF domain-containing protein [Deltaproteobacteria bacterium]|nr:GYF domain-containing protein [Deltaproteobacteria bacterium]